MSKTRLLITLVAIVGTVAVISGLFLYQRSEDEVLPQPAGAEYRTSAGLGITYIKVTPVLSEYYGLGVDYGALVTEVTPGSPAYRAGAQAGDVILSFNGARLQEHTPLLGMMMACQAGNKVRLELWGKTEIRIVEFFHEGR